MNVFVDTEFSSLGSDPRLISIALVAENGEELYIEFQSGWTFDQCSSWVRTHVLPFLGDGEKLDRRAAVKRIDQWLQQLPAPVKIVVDSSWDAELIQQLFAETVIDGLTYDIETVKLADRSEADKFDEIRRRYFFENHCHSHHALHDARALQFAIQYNVSR